MEEGGNSLSKHVENSPLNRIVREISVIIHKDHLKVKVRVDKDTSSPCLTVVLVLTLIKVSVLCVSVKYVTTGCRQRLHTSISHRH